MRQLLLSGIDCWKDLPIFMARDYLFKRNGIGAILEKDENLIISMIEKQLPKEEVKLEESKKLKKKVTEPVPEAIANEEILGTF